MSHYLFSDVHLRPDRPARAERLSRWVQQLHREDHLIVGGDLCDFWMASRVPRGDLMRCPGLRALADFRERGGGLLIMTGNHDLWMSDFYERALGAGILVEPAELLIQGVRIHLVHGHLLGARKRWKGWMESREFHRAFGRVPGPIAGVLDRVLEWKNLRSLEGDEERHLKVFRDYADGRRGRCDLVVIGHVHRAFDDGRSDPRLIVLGGWQRRSTYLQIDEGTVRFHVIDPKFQDQPGVPTTP